ncbi:MAG: hypothetical protein N2544_12020 [Burkholderiales bacterium]|nr:hypothetical protein [Burkholderiales bacterium]
MPSEETPAEGPRRGAIDRRRFLALGAGALAAGLAGCQSGPPVVAETVTEPLAAPRAGDTWRYRYVSGWPQIPSRDFSVTVTQTAPNGIVDSLSAAGFAAQTQLWTGTLAFVPRPLGGFAVTEFSPYIMAFVRLATGQVWYNIPLPSGAAPLTPWSAEARVRGLDAVTVPAGTFDAVRVDLNGFRRGPGVAPSADTAQLSATAWYAPAVRRVVRFRHQTWTLTMLPIDNDGYELLEYKPA